MAEVLECNASDYEDGYVYVWVGGDKLKKGKKDKLKKGQGKES
ncbi:predicted protein [Sclerotinia sclerotiorum 1980 UF-70]|uniref:Uncharacterized protein n=1 Tax=Sclerotinia sclerotiorum (strain ATCC 18683 / 1980 / Ss-1) TaxID=665079 RepID=A7F520_SCLS1|nr:predicted protein [Sclerotinia sclerotiorum 1980 UF-70]EDN97841.1 predicted protein [Sclerotinia sclerotiorum 1980 UF-70]